MHIASLLVCFAVTACMAATVPIIKDFSGSGTVTQGGQPLDFTIIDDISGLRKYQYYGGLNESTFTYQAYATAVTYEYTLMSSGCSCRVLQGAVVMSLFQNLNAASQNTSVSAAAACAGTLYSSNSVGAPGAQGMDFCFSGDTPVSVTLGPTTWTFKNFTAGRPTFFPDELLAANLGPCQSECT